MPYREDIELTDFTPEDLAVLTQWDTPTICNALEEVMPERRGHGYTTEPLVPLEQCGAHLDLQHGSHARSELREALLVGEAARGVVTLALSGTSKRSALAESQREKTLRHLRVASLASKV